MAKAMGGKPRVWTGEEVDDIDRRAKSLLKKLRPMKLRPAVQRFAEAMEMKLRKHDEDRGEDGWDGEDLWWLHQRALEELGEAFRVLLARIAAQGARDFDIVADLEKDAAEEYVDAANFCMMAFDVLGGGK